ncbi:MAG: 30S ribosomal protein S1, partial [Pelotomaculum thermopropionicum]
MANSTKKMTMEELLKANADNLVVPQKGDTVTGVIVEKNKKNLVIDLGAKTEAYVADKE